MKVRKKETFEVEQWFPGKKVEEVTGDNPNHLCGCVTTGFKYHDKPHVHLEDFTVQRVESGDWIIKDKKGRRNVVSPDEFERIFEKVT